MPSAAVQVLLTPLVPEGAERRVAERYTFPAGAESRVYVPAADSSLPASAMDISLSGVGLRLPQHVGRNALILLQFRSADAGRALNRPAAVVYCRPSSGGGYFLGCRFNPPLTAAELDALLGAKGDRPA